MTCENCIHYEVCEELWQMNGIPKVGASQCAFYKDKYLHIELPCKVGDTVYVDSRTLPTNEIDLFEANLEELPKFFEGKIVSIRKNSKGWFFKFAITTYWIENYFDFEIGEDCCTTHMRRYFTYPKGAIGITVFLSKEEAERALGGKNA